MQVLCSRYSDEEYFKNRCKGNFRHVFMSIFFSFFHMGISLFFLFFLCENKFDPVVYNMGMRWAQVVVKLNTVTKFLFQQQLTLFL